MRVFAALQRALELLGPAGSGRDRASVETVPRPEPQRVLVVDDSVAALDAAERVLAGEGFLPITTTASHSALQLARSMRPNLIFLDVYMPGFDGWDVLATLKADPSTKDIPVLMISMMGERRRALEVGAAGVVPPPLNTARVRAALAAMTGGGRRKLKTTYNIQDT
jgi:CheY-like chemotaxis protein